MYYLKAAGWIVGAIVLWPLTLIFMLVKFIKWAWKWPAT